MANRKDSTATKKRTNGTRISAGKKGRTHWPFPRATLEEALKIPYAIKDHNGGNPWEPDEVRKAIKAGSGNSYYYLTAASRDYGFTVGTRNTEKISLGELGRELVYAPNPDAEKNLKVQAFLNIDIFKRVLGYYKGSNLPDMMYLGNVLQKQFGLGPETHEEFSRIFRENCQYLGIKSGIPTSGEDTTEPSTGTSVPETITLAEPEGASKLTAFVIMPFVERDQKHPQGFFGEVLRSIITPAAKASQFTVKTANRQGSDVIQSTIINDLMDADLVIADLTEHNPNVMFELGMRMAERAGLANLNSEISGFSA